MQGKSLLEFKYLGQKHSIRASEHALERAEERGIAINVILSEVIALPVADMQKYKENNKECIIIDDNRDIAVVVGFKGNKINIITVIDKADVWIKEGTAIKKI